MKNTALLIYLAFFGGLLFLLSSTTTSKVSQQESMNLLPVGTVIYSILSPDFIKSKYKGEWVPLNGDPIKKEWTLFKHLEEDPKYRADHLRGKVKGRHLLPNASGRFIRTMNYDKRGIDFNKSRLVGNKQSDATRIPNNVTSADGSHVHIVKDLKSALIDGNRGRNTAGMEYANVEMMNPGFNSPYTSENGSHTHKINGGNKETRPHNIALYAYIKVR